MSELKISYIGSLSGYAGVEIYSRGLYNSLRKRNISVDHKNPYNIIKPRFLNNLLLDGFKVDKNADVNHITNQDLFSGYYVPNAQNIVVTVHDIFPYTEDFAGPFYQYMAKRYVKNLEEYADKIIAISEATKKQLVENTGVSSSKLEVIYQGVDLEKFRPIKDTNDYGDYYLHVGSEISRKNISGLFKIFSEIKKSYSNAKLIRVGSLRRENKKKLEEYDLELGKDVLYLQDITEKELINLYSNSKALLFPSHVEGFGRPIIESLACGTPVIAYNRKPMSEILSQDMLVEDEEEFVDKALNFNSSQEKNRSIAENYSWEKTAVRTEDVYKEICRY